MNVGQLRSNTRGITESAQAFALRWTASMAADMDLMLVLNANAEHAAILAADWYDQQADTPNFAALADAGSAQDRLEKVLEWVNAGPQTPEARIVAAAHKLIFDAARNTVLVNARREGVAVARHENDTDCGHCIARATTTAKARNSSSEDVDLLFHPSCEGLLVPVRGELYKPPDHARAWHERIVAARQAGNVSHDDIAKWLSAH